MRLENVSSRDPYLDLEPDPRAIAAISLMQKRFRRSGLSAVISQADIAVEDYSPRGANLLEKEVSRRLSGRGECIRTTDEKRWSGSQLVVHQAEHLMFRLIRDRFPHAQGIAGLTTRHKIDESRALITLGIDDGAGALVTQLEEIIDLGLAESNRIIEEL